MNYMMRIYQFVKTLENYSTMPQQVVFAMEPYRNMRSCWIFYREPKYVTNKCGYSTNVG